MLYNALNNARIAATLYSLSGEAADNGGEENEGGHEGGETADEVTVDDEESLLIA